MSGTEETRSWQTSQRPLLISVPQAARLLGISRAAAYRFASAGELPTKRVLPSRPRTPPDLARTPEDITTIGRTTDAVTCILRHDMRSAGQAATAGWIYSPARLLPESDDLRHIYRYRHAPPDQITELRAAYHHAITATETVTAAMDGLVADLCTPGEPYALARALQRHPLDAHPQPPNAVALTSHPTAGAGDIERLLHSLRVTDPHLLFRAIALDHATRDLTAEALAKTQLLANLTQDTGHATDCRSSSRRNHSARLAAQDLLIAAGGPALAPSSAKCPERSGRQYLATSTRRTTATPALTWRERQVMRRASINACRRL